MSGSVRAAPVRAAIVALALAAPVLQSFEATAGAAPAPPTASASALGSGAPALLAFPGGVVWDYDGSQNLAEYRWGRHVASGATDLGAHPDFAAGDRGVLPQPRRCVGGDGARVAGAARRHYHLADDGRRGHVEPGDLVAGGAVLRDARFRRVRLRRRQPRLWFRGGRSGHDWLRTAAPGLLVGYDQWRSGLAAPAIGLPWQGSTFSSASASASSAPATGCSVPDPFNITAVSDSLVLLADAGCPATKPGLWRSSDGGRDWGPVELPAPPGGWTAAEAWRYPGVARSGAEVMAVRFFQHGRGVAAVTVRPGEVLVYRTSDSGASWSPASHLETGSLTRPAGFWASTPLVWELPAPAGLYVTTDAGRRWGLRRSALSLPDMVEASFASPASGVGFSGGLGLGLASTGDTGMRTPDGGQSWTAVEFPAPAFLGNVTTEVPFSTVTFATSRDGWVGGADGIAATTDGGKTWTAQLATAEPVEQLSFAGPEHGWALTPDQLFTTSDGGEHWSAQPETGLGAFSSVQLVSAGFGLGVICGQPGGTRALATYNGGRRWRLLPVPDPDALGCGSVPPSPGTMTGLCFGTAQTGWAVWRRPDEAPAVVGRTDDGGLRWSEVATVNPSPGSLACLGSSNAWLGLNWMENMATVGGIAATSDGGRTWSTSVHPAPGRPFSVPSLRPSDGTPVGTLGAVQTPAGILTEPVAALALPAPGNAVDLWEDYGPACTSGFGLAFTSNGGSSWAGAPGIAPNPPRCGAIAPPYLSSVPDLAPSFSFPDAHHGFVLGPVAGTPAVAKGVAEPVTLALIATTDGGSTWQLLARFPWRPPATTEPR